MKNLLLSLTAVLALSGSILAEENNAYTELSYQSISPEDDVILGIQPTDELIGGDLDIYKLSVGFSIPDKADILAGSRFGLYGTYSNSVETDISGGIDFTVKHQPFNFYGLIPYFGGNFGIGWRDDKGVRRNTSTSVNKYNYVSTQDLSTLKTPDVAIFDKDTTWVEYGFSIGLEYAIGNFAVKGGYLYQYRSYGVAYRLESSSKILNSLTINQRYNGLEVSVAYKF